MKRIQKRERGMREGRSGNSGGSCPGGRNGESILDEGKGRTRVRRRREGDDDEEVEKKEEVKAAMAVAVATAEGWVGVATAVWRHTTHRGRWQQDVCEVSLLPRRWQERGKPDVTYAASSGHCAAA